MDLLVSRYARYYIFPVRSRDDHIYKNSPTPKRRRRALGEQNLEPLLGSLDGHAAVRLADGQFVDDVLLLGLHLP